jgi:hypothetical protein
MATKGTAWVARRSTDLVPSLIAMAFAEWRSGHAPDPELSDPAVGVQLSGPAPQAAAYGMEMPR